MRYRFYTQPPWAPIHRGGRVPRKLKKRRLMPSFRAGWRLAGEAPPNFDFNTITLVQWGEVLTLTPRHLDPRRWRR